MTKPIEKDLETKSTTDYKLFDVMGSNRETTKAHIKKIKQSMAEHPEVFQYRPILVNKDMYVIDGQHRLAAAKELGVPVYYQVIEDGDIKTTRLLNANQRNWQFLDFARSYANSGNKDYQAYLDLREDYPQLDHSAVTAVLSDRIGRSSTQSFRKGDFKVSVSAERANDLAERLVEFQEIVKKDLVGRTSTPFMALLNMFRNEEYNHEKFIKNLKSRPIFTPRPLMRDYLRDFEYIYNLSVPERDRTRFF